MPLKAGKYFTCFLLSVFLLLCSSCEIQKLPLASSWEPNPGNRPSELPAPKTLFENFHGLSVNEKIYMEGEGYDMFIERDNLTPDAKGFERIRTKFLPGCKITATNSADFPLPNETIQKLDTIAPGAIAIQTMYIFPSPEKGMLTVGFMTFNSVDYTFQINVSKSILYDGIEKSFFSTVQADSIDFIGRKIMLGPACHWVSPHNVQCSMRGEMNWSIHKTLEQAKEFTKIQLACARTKGTVLKEEDVPVIFEGTETMAKRVTYKMGFPRIIAGGASNVLIGYFVTAVVRGKYVHCVMSFYDDQGRVGGLAPLIAEVMKLK